MGTFFKISTVFERIPYILQYFPVTVELTLSSLALGLLLGLLIALAQVRDIPILKQVTAVYVSVVRGTPMLVQLYVIYYGVPMFLQVVNYYKGTNYNIQSFPNILFAVIALSFNTAAYMAVTIKASIESVDHGQLEAAETLGMSYWQTLGRIIIPEAIEVAVPSIGNTGINLMKSTSLAFSCAVVECTAAARIAASQDYRFLESYVALALIYWVITIALEQLVRLASNSVKVPDVVPNKKYMEDAS